MPESVEVKISTELTRPLVINKRITNIQLGSSGRYKNDNPEGFEELQKLLQSPVKILDVKNRGKFMYWSFNNDWHMFVTFGMTGQWSPTAGKHVCLEIELVDDNNTKTYMYFNDPRHFGTIKFIKGTDKLKEKLNSLGWDPLSGMSLDKWLNWIHSQVVKSNKPIGQILLDQSIYSGTGNYIRCEALYEAQISPWRSGKEFTKQDTEILCKAIANVMDESYKYQGATIQTYKDAYGNEGKYSSKFKVYGQKTDPNGHPIIKETTPEGRTIHWCPNIQK